MISPSILKSDNTDWSASAFVANSSFDRAYSFLPSGFDRMSISGGLYFLRSFKSISSCVITFGSTFSSLKLWTVWFLKLSKSILGSTFLKLSTFSLVLVLFVLFTIE